MQKENFCRCFLANLEKSWNSSEISEIISAGFSLHLLQDAPRPWAFAVLCRALQWRRGDKSRVQGLESGCSQSSVMSWHSSTSEGSLEASGSLFNLYKIMDIMPRGFCCCFLLSYFVSCQPRLDSEVLRLWGQRWLHSPRIPSALEFSWEAECEEIPVLLHPQSCSWPPSCLQAFWQLLSTALLSWPAQSHPGHVNITNYTKDPEGNKLPPRPWVRKKEIIPSSYSDWPLTVVLKPNKTKQNKVIQQQSLFINSGSLRKRKETFFQVDSRFIEFWV